MKLKINAKCSDGFYSELYAEDGSLIGKYDGYVPDFFPGTHFGDYVQLDIDTNTGRILNWPKNIDSDMLETHSQEENYE